MDGTSSGSFVDWSGTLGSLLWKKDDAEFAINPK
jgi:hypothetical protein